MLIAVAAGRSLSGLSSRSGDRLESPPNIKNNKGGLTFKKHNYINSTDLSCRDRIIVVRTRRKNESKFVNAYISVLSM